jgi:hypothetical protein
MSAETTRLCQCGITNVSSAPTPVTAAAPNAIMAIGSAGMASQRLKERGVNRVAVLVYGGGAVLLAPWIVVLALSQKQSTDGYHLRLSSLGMSVFIVAGLVRTAITCRRQYPGVVVPASLAATFLFISGWFNTITAKHGPLAIALAYDVFVKLPTIALALWRIAQSAPVLDRP